VVVLPILYLIQQLKSETRGWSRRHTDALRIGSYVESRNPLFCSQVGDCSTDRGCPSDADFCLFQVMWRLTVAGCKRGQCRGRLWRSINRTLLGRLKNYLFSFVGSSCRMMWRLGYMGRLDQQMKSVVSSSAVVCRQMERGHHSCSYLAVQMT
jgi:hypothetical protein